MTIDLRGLRLAYGEVEALCDVSLRVDCGESVALVGASGSGKSSLLYCASGLVFPDSGSVRVGGVDLGSLDGEGLAALRRTEFGFVFQFSELVPELTLQDNVGLPLDLLGVGRRERRERVGELMAGLGLEHRANARPGQVSGGEAQRAAVARALVHRPSVVFADEPTGALDSLNGERVLDRLLGLTRESGTVLVLVTHDARVAARADRVVTLADGQIYDDSRGATA